MKSKKWIPDRKSGNMPFSPVDSASTAAEEPRPDKKSSLLNARPHWLRPDTSAGDVLQRDHVRNEASGHRDTTVHALPTL